jgi:hypothetical protein
MVGVDSGRNITDGLRTPEDYELLVYTLPERFSYGNNPANPVNPV